MGFKDGKRAIASIHHPEHGQIVGTGFLVAERYLFTCAHVIQAALGNDWKTNKTLIPIRFLDADVSAILEPSHQARVVWQQLDEALEVYRNDFALLELTAVAPAAVEPISLKPLGADNALSLQSFGFPPGDTAGRNLTASIIGGIRGGWVQIESLRATGLAVEEGFSGAPVWCEAIHGWVGMMVAKDRRRPQERVGFIIPTERLSPPLRALRRRTLHDILKPYKQQISVQIVKAYQVCRPQGWRSSYVNQLELVLNDLSQMPEGEAACPRLVQFAAALLSQTLTPVLRLSLEQWANSQVDDLLTLRQTMLDKLDSVIVKPSSEPNSGLLVTVRPHNSEQEQYYVNAWLVRDFNAYTPETGEGSEQLIFPQAVQGDKDATLIDPETGVSCSDIPILLADYLTQAGNCGIDLQSLTVEIFVPLELLNTAFEQWIIPDDEGFPQPLRQDCHIVVRSHERLEGYRQRGRWQAKWKCLKQRENRHAQPLFLSGEENLRQLVKKFDSSEDALGLKLSKLPNTERGGELALVLRTGIPIAIWVREQAPTVDWGDRINSRLLSCCLKSVPERVADVRRAAPDRTEADPKPALELGHHLSFVWEDPHRVPPTDPLRHPSLYSGSAL